MSEMVLTDSQTQRLLSKFIEDASGCWLWQGALDKDGYGRFSITHSCTRQAHRVMYAVKKGALQSKLTIDHLCGVRSCVNPDHLDQVSIKENTLRSNNTLASINKKKSHCKNGHEFTIDNTYFDRGKRACRTCSRENSHKTYMRRTYGKEAV